MASESDLQEMFQYFRIQKLLNEEAKYLDDWRLQDWLSLYTEDASYYVPPTDIAAAEADPTKHLYYIADNRGRMDERVTRLEKKTCHAEFPRSKVQHVVSNIVVNDSLENGRLSVSASFVIYRSKNGSTDMFMGSYLYELANIEGQLRICKKVCSLALDGLRPQAKISIIL